MFPIYVLEGPDGSGKTTLGKFLAEQFGAHYMHLTYRFKDQMFTYHAAALDRAIRLSKTKPVIIDRWWPSINIYDDEFRQRRDFPMAGRMLDRAGLATGVVYVVCIPSNEGAQLLRFEERKAAGGEMFDSVTGVNARYREWFTANKYRADVTLYDWTTMGRDMDAFARDLHRRALQIHNRIPAWFWNNRQYGGNVFVGHPKWMIVGERSNPKGRHDVWPFFEHGYSSLWVTEALEEAGVSEYEIVWANAIDKAGWAQPAELRRMANETTPTRIVALGNRAEQVLWSAGLGSKTTKLPHPAYVKRFQQGDKTEYLNTFKG
jgi:hypothetical protein